MGPFTTRWRRATTGGPGARRGLSPELRAALPPHFEAVGETLASGSGTVAACQVAGALVARDGRSLDEALDALAATSRLVLGTDPDFQDSAALAVAWSDAVLGYLHRLSCEDPLTGLASLAHLRSRVADAYREQGTAGTPVSRSHALVVVASPPWPEPAPDPDPEVGPDPGPCPDDVLTRAMRTARVGDTARTVFAGGETIGHVAPGRVVVLAGRDDRIGRRVGLLRRLLEGSAAEHTRVWIEGLPESDEAAGALLDELARV